MRLTGILLLVAALPTAAAALSDRDVGSFVALSDSFYERLGDAARINASAGAKEANARCVLGRFEDSYGASGVADLLAMMTVLSRGVAFDDRTVVGFNEKYGQAYRETLRACS